MVALWQCLVLAAMPISMRAIIIPDAFSYSGQAYEVPHASLDSVLTLLSRFELDTHFEIVLVGEVFDADTSHKLALRLESLSKVSAFASPLAFVHEKIIYHTAVGNVLVDSVRDIVQSSKSGSGNNLVVDPTKIGKILAEYHSRAATTTTLFVYHGNHRNSENKAASYSYSSLLPYCSQMTFIARDASFAWIDLSATAQYIQPAVLGKHILVPPSTGRGTLFDQEGDMDELASLLHTSAEALSPFPHPSFQSADFTVGGTTGLGNGSSAMSRMEAFFDAPAANYYKQKRDGSQLGQYLPSPPRNVHIMVITICLDGILGPGGKSVNCEEDLKTLMVAEQLIRFYSSPSLQMTTDVFLIKASEDLQIAHAIHSSVSYYNPTVLDDSQAFTISSSEFIYWLSTSTAIKNLVLQSPHNTAETLLLPVFVLRTAPSLEIFFDESYQQTLSLPFYEPVDVADKIRKSNRVRRSPDGPTEPYWPKLAIAAIRYSGSAGLPMGSLTKVHPALRCAGLSLPPGDGYADDEMRHAMRESIWGISPPRFHYSSSSRNVVQDFLWATPPALRRAGSNINGADSFREKRAVYRHTFIHRAENILRRFADAIRLAASVVPSVNTSKLLDLQEPPSFPPPLPVSSSATVSNGGGGSSSSKRGQGLAARQPTYASSRASSKAKKTSKKGLLEEFLFFMRDAAAEFSHLEYDAALLQLDSAEIKAQILESRIADVIALRTGSITCTRPTNSTIMEEAERQSTAMASSWPTGYLRTLLFVVCGLVVGCVAFFFADETSGTPRIRRKRVE